MNTFLRRYSTVLMTGTLVTAMGAAFWFGILPLRDLVWTKMNEIQKMHTNRENRTRQIGTLPELQVQFDEIKADEKSLQIFLSEDQIVDFIKTLEGLALDTGIQIVIQSSDKGAIVQKKVPAKNPTPTAADSDASPTASSTSATDTDKKKSTGILNNLPYDRYVRLGVTVSGKYEGIITFLHRMETLPFALDVVAADVSVQTEENASSARGSDVSPFTPLGEQGSGVQPDQPAERQVIATFDTVIYLTP